MNTSRFPPSFDGNPWSYGFALFSLTLISAIALTILIGYLSEARARREIDERIGNMVPAALSPSALSPYVLHRLIIAGLMLTIVLGAVPDVLLLLAWGEAGDSTLDTLFLVDRVCDGLTLAPFLASTLLLLWAGQAVDHRLSIEPVKVRLRPSWQAIRERLKLVLLVLLIAVGVTFAKSIA